MSVCIRTAFDSRVLVSRLRRSLINEDLGWSINSKSTTPIELEYHAPGIDHAIYIISVTPRTGSCFCSCCDRVQLKVNNTLIPLSPGKSWKLSRVARMYVTRYAREVSENYPVLPPTE